MNCIHINACILILKIHNRSLNYPLLIIKLLKVINRVFKMDAMKWLPAPEVSIPSHTPINLLISSRASVSCGKSFSDMEYMFAQ